uniref:1-phosphatidylinositol-3-phosphate 5-kinase n=1 Tax=Globisporangium ultimum (strain ATCC 200006 / CBS 805.95 / DAOM BR144) TaxID=431595 RepID=K3WK83_GLOUD
MASPARQTQSMPHHQRLDLDPSRLTTFPMPGFMGSSSGSSFPKEPMSERPSIQADSASRNIPAPPHSTGNQYWMPDHLCKARAVVISDQFIEGSPHGHTGLIRVCKFCARFIEDAERKKNLLNGQRRTSLSRGSSLGITSAPSVDYRNADAEPQLQTSPLLCVADDTSTIMDSMDASEVSSTYLNPPLSPDVSGGDRSSALPPLFTIQSSESMEVVDPEGKLVQRPFRPKPPGHRRRRSSVELLGAIESGGLRDMDLDQLKLTSTEHDGRATSPTTDPPVSFRVKDTYTTRDMMLGKYLEAAHDQIRAGIRLTVGAVAENLKPGGDVDLQRLAGSLEDIAFVVAGHLLFSMNFRMANGFNYSSLVKVKSIAMAETVQKNVKKESKYQFKWLAGTLCRKHLSHKQMARQIANPRILLFACGISYDRSAGAGRLNSLDTLLEQERSYMSILVDKITALKPDVIFVERTVSRHAQELLRARGVGIVLNVKFEILERISRHTGATLLTSVDHVDKSDPKEVVGTCRSFLVKSIPTVPVGDQAEKVAAPSVAGVTLGTPAGSRAKTETYLYLDGCDPLNGCTVLLTGPTKAKLRVLKGLTRSVLSMTYRLLLEAHVLSELELQKPGLMPRSAKAFSEEGATTWYTTCTLRVREQSSTNVRYHPCTSSKHFGIQAYSDMDISFGNLLTQEMGMLLLKCQNSKCSYPMADHVQTFSCSTGTVTISFEELPPESRLPISRLSLNQNGDREEGASSMADTNRPAFLSKLLGKDINVMGMLTGIYEPPQFESNGATATEPESYPSIVFWRWCRECNGMVSPFVPLEKYIYKYSFARFLDVMFSEDKATDLLPPADLCPHVSMESQVLFFNIGDSVARFDFAKKIPLCLVRGDGRLKRGFSFDMVADKEDHIVVEHVVMKRLTSMKQLLDSLIELFTEKIQGVKQAVEAFEKCDDTLQAQVVLEVVCLKKLIQSDQLVFLHKVEKLEANAANNLAECDTAQRSLYLLACRWIDRMLKLRKLIKKNLSKEAAAAMTSSSFTLAGFSFSTPTTLSPIASPRHRDEGEHSSLTPSAISRDSTDFLWDGAKERSKRRSSDGLSINGSDISPESSIVSSAASSFLNFESGRRTPSNQSYDRSASGRNGDQRDQSQSGWRTALWDLYKVLGRNTPGSDFNVDLPEALLAGHPSLPYRSGDNVVLVNNSEPITCVAYALSSDLYEEQLDSWKLIVQKEVEASVDKNHPVSSSPISTNWSRAALETALNVPFKYSICEIPLHLSLLSGTSSANALNSPWEFSAIAYYPLQFEVLRELFYGTLDNFLFSIAHVKNWDANGGKSGASFYRTLDDRFVIKHISSTELQSFLEVLPGYFKYMSKVYFDGEASIISKTVGLYQTMVTRKETGQKTVHYVAVMENAFSHKRIMQTYDLKGSSRNRYIKSIDGKYEHGRVLLDGNLLEYSHGHPLGVLAEDHEFIVKAIKNDADFLNSINIIDYSMVVGLGELEGENLAFTEMTIGIIDYYRQFDLIKRVESVGKSVGMIAGQSSPTIIEPALYGKRFIDAINRYFMPVT